MQKGALKKGRGLQTHLAAKLIVESAQSSKRIFFHVTMTQAVYFVTGKDLRKI